ncbi:MAG: heavy metal translocating P-type ATPase, partial [Rhodothermales bacterium]|nr:heavy metal translocating P-type ATPase [Rhodothermales bacterium]
MTEKTLAELTILLPDIQNDRDKCVERLVDALKARAGVDAAHVLERDTDAPGTLCIHYDPDRISLQEARTLAERSGMQLSERYGHLLAEVEPMQPRQARRLSDKLMRQSGILEAHVSADGAVRIEFDRDVLDEAQARDVFR